MKIRAKRVREVAAWARFRGMQPPPPCRPVGGDPAMAGSAWQAGFSAACVEIADKLEGLLAQAQEEENARKLALEVASLVGGGEDLDVAVRRAYLRRRTG